MIRRIMHVDMDAFFASVEQADNPQYLGKPVIVGGAERGVVCAASYEARKYGVHSAMPIFQAKRLCPEGIYLRVRMSRYKEISRKVMEILSAVSPLVEQVSIDEAFADISGTEELHGPAHSLGLHVKSAVREATSLTCSVGIAPNKFLAKIASDFNKPDGLTIIEQEDVQAFLQSLPVRKIPGVGKRTAEELKNLGVVFASDILKLPLPFWNKKFGKWGLRLYEKARGIDDSPVEPCSDPEVDQRRGNLFSRHRQPGGTRKDAHGAGGGSRPRPAQDGLQGRTVTLKIKFSDFRIVTRSRTLPEPVDSTRDLFEVGPATPERTEAAPESAAHRDRRFQLLIRAQADENGTRAGNGAAPPRG